MDCRTDRCGCCCKKVNPPPDLDEDGCEIPSNKCTKNTNSATRPAPKTPKEITKQTSETENDMKKDNFKVDVRDDGEENRTPIKNDYSKKDNSKVEECDDDEENRASIKNDVSKKDNSKVEECDDDEENRTPIINCYSNKGPKDHVLVIKTRDPLQLSLSEKENVCKEEVQTEKDSELKSETDMKSKPLAIGTDDCEDQISEEPPQITETEDDCNTNLMALENPSENATDEDCETETQSKGKEGKEGKKYCYSKKGPKSPVMMIRNEDGTFILSEKDDSCKDDANDPEKFQKEREKPIFGEKAAESIRATVGALFTKTRDIWNGSRCNDETSKV
ncbi:helicase SWR1 [Plutella xylostella]|uniref:helicase SWR1 n=1 Tax=Plutella xylostella TaxID=51655 RepID=UPI00203297DE|nr:helicase SWR1 [Plutella xylostella]XP_037966345.2 helicase SWR1 [Plutella xylostella]